ncbi:hypothetical protein M9458_032250, partial [Cirrhinus mrigala]
ATCYCVGNSTPPPDPSLISPPSSPSPSCSWVDSPPPASRLSAPYNAQSNAHGCRRCCCCCSCQHSADPPPTTPSVPQPRPSTPPWTNQLAL